MGNRFNVAAVPTGAPDTQGPDPRESGKPFFIVIGLLKGANAPSIYYTERVEAEAEAKRLATQSLGNKFGVAEIVSIAQTPAAELVSLR